MLTPEIYHEVAKLGGTDSKFGKKISRFETVEEIAEWTNKLSAELRAKGYDPAVVNLFVTDYAYRYAERKAIFRAVQKNPLLRLKGMVEFADLWQAILCAHKDHLLNRNQKEQLAELLQAI